MPPSFAPSFTLLLSLLMACAQGKVSDEKRAATVANPSPEPAAAALDPNDALQIVGGSIVASTDKISTSTVILINQYFPDANHYTYGSCTASLVDNQFILTAGHCVSNFGNYQFVKSFVVFGGVVDVAKFLSSNYTSAPYRPVVAYVPNPNFNPANAFSDIGLAKFTGGIPQGYSQVQLSTQRPTVGQLVVMAGYGFTGWQSNDAGTLRSVSTVVTGVNEDHSLATQSPGKTNCSGDSGGPVFATVDNKSVQTAVISNTGDYCASVGGSIMVADFVSWISAQGAVPLLQSPPGKPCGSLAAGTSLKVNETLFSCDGARYYVKMQDDGNLVVYDTKPVTKALWSTKTFGKPQINAATMQTDGNFVLYANRTPYWNSGTNKDGQNTSAYVLIMQTDGNLVTYKQITPGVFKPTWSWMSGFIQKL